MLAEQTMLVVIDLQPDSGIDVYLDFLLRPMARPSTKASNTTNTTRMAMQTIFLLKVKYFLWPGMK